MDVKGNIVKFWESGKATVLNVFFKFKMSDEEFEKVSKFVEENGFKMANHIVFKLDNNMFVGVSDGGLLIGKSIEEKS